MTASQAGLLDWAPAFALVFARVGAAMALLPGIGEASAPAIVRIGLALGITILLLPEIQPMMPPVPAAGLSMGLMIASEVVTGLWFGWVARMIALALPVGAQFIGYLIGLSSVLQPDSELGAQSGALGKLFEMAAPVLLLLTGLYKLPLTALDGLFRLIPPGHMLPAADSTEVAIHAVGSGFSLALQLASPFVVIGIVWHLAMGQIARIVSRMQIYFVSMPGQILARLALLIITGSAMILAWRDSAQTFLAALPGSGLSVAEGEQSDGDRTEAATQRHVDQARDAGQIPISREVATFASLAAVVLVLSYRMQGIVQHLLPNLVVFLARAGDLHVPGAGQLRLALSAVLGAIVPILAISIFAGGAAVLLQSKFLLHLGGPQPKFSRVSPVAGLKRVFGFNGIVEMVNHLAS